MNQKFQKKRTSGKDEGIPVASMPDIIFMLLIFFMVTTVLRETEVQVRTQLPEAEALTKIEQRRFVSNIWIGPLRLPGNQLGDTRVQIDDALMEEDEFPTIRNIMYRKLQEEPRLIVSLRVDVTAEMGILTDVQEELREANTLRINYSSRQQQ